MKNSDSKPPTPEELTKKLREFMKSTFGDNVNFAAFSGGAPPQEASPEEPEAPKESDKKRQPIFEFDYRPKEIKQHLDRFVIRQEDAKKALSLAVCDHYNHAKYLKRLADEHPDKCDQIEFAKQNVVILGLTGVGKTYLVKHIAELIGVPFVKADATKFSETGYVGGDVDDLVRELVKRADGDVSLAEYGIIYIDEIDKLATRGNMMGRDVSGRGVQTALLKLMEDTEVSVRNPMDIQSQMQAMFQMRAGGGPSKDSVRTRHILFIVSGAFSGLQEIISKRIGRQSIGFEAVSEQTANEDSVFRSVNTQDFLDYGFEAEFIGRLPVRVVCDPLDKDALCEIMERSEGSLIRQYEREFEAYGVRARFDRSALEAIAAQAVHEKTGARGLMTVCESVLRDFKFELADSGLSELVIDGELFEHPQAVLARHLELHGDAHSRVIQQELDTFCRGFRDRFGLDLSFDLSAICALASLCEEKNMSPLAWCEQTFEDYQFGLKLIEKNTGRRSFRLPERAIADPEGFLSDLVLKSYQSPDSSGRSRPPEQPAPEPGGDERPLLET